MRCSEFVGFNWFKITVKRDASSVVKFKSLEISPKIKAPIAVPPVFSEYISITGFTEFKVDAILNRAFESPNKKFPSPKEQLSFYQMLNQKIIHYR